ncbi:hypothetical protein ACFW04_003070 [Cataglyphis niger]
MDMESLYDYVEEDQDFYEETPATRKGGYPIDHRSIKRDVRSMGSFLASGIDGSGMLTIMTKLKQELFSDAEEESLVPNIPGRDTSMQKVPSVSDLSDLESSLGEFLQSVCFNVSSCPLSRNIIFKEHNLHINNLRML